MQGFYLEKNMRKQGNLKSILSPQTVKSVRIGIATKPPSEISLETNNMALERKINQRDLLKSFQ